MGVFIWRTLFAAYQVPSFAINPFRWFLWRARRGAWVSPAVFSVFAGRSPPSEEAALDATAETGHRDNTPDSSAPGQPPKRNRGRRRLAAVGTRHCRRRGNCGNQSFNTR